MVGAGAYDNSTRTVAAILELRYRSFVLCLRFRPCTLADPIHYKDTAALTNLHEHLTKNHVSSDQTSLPSLPLSPEHLCVVTSSSLVPSRIHCHTTPVRSRSRLAGRWL